MQKEVGGYYHIYNKGVEGRDIFMEERDRWRFLQALALFRSEENHEKTLWNLERKEEGANMRSLEELLSDKNDELLVKVMADCLMNNHYHLILKEVAEDGISKFMQKFATGYTMYFNRKYDRSGGLFKGGYKFKKVDSDLYLQYLLVYINVVNPAEIIQPNLRRVGAKNIDKIMDFVADYDWSTHKEYLQTRDSFIIDKDILGNIFSSPKRYEEFCRMVLRSEKYKQIEHLTIE